MAPTSRLYNALNDFLRQCDIVWQDARHLQTLCWMFIGMIQSQNVHLNEFRLYAISHAQVALNLEASRLWGKFALSQLCGVIALTMLFLILQGVQMVASGKRHQVDTHWKRGMSYLKIGWDWIRLAITQQLKIPAHLFVCSGRDPQPVFTSNDNKMMLSSVNSPFSLAFQLLSFVNQAGSGSVDGRAI